MPERETDGPQGEDGHQEGDAPNNGGAPAGGEVRGDVGHHGACVSAVGPAARSIRTSLRRSGPGVNGSL